MIFINIGALRNQLPEQWEARARRALDEIRPLLPEERAAAISERAPLWREIKDKLEALSNGKCWYCESRQSRSDMAVDHFRPKNQVAESEGHLGYWWLAFNWTNYRFSCTYCNSHRRDKANQTTGGKQDHFPLADEGMRARGEQDDTSREDPILLDPTSVTDPIMLWFQDDGRAMPRVSETLNEYQHHRAESSIAMYHLNHSSLQEQRLALFNEIRELIEVGKVYFNEYCSGNSAATVGHSQIVGKLRALQLEGSVYSAGARDIIRSLRDESHPWIGAL
jgi:uncharacterized protein (TIGR02646 family)